VDKVRERKQARRKADWADPDRRRKDRDRQFRWKYGITHDEYDQRLADQGGRCAICGGTDPRGRKGGELFAVDHDHETGAVRGLLCIPCNSGLGQFGDDPDTMLSAATYVMQTRDVLGPIRT
jgi:hypothetical protein